MARRKIYEAGKRKKRAEREYDEVKPKRDRGRIESQHFKWWLCATGKEAAQTLWQWVDKQRPMWSMDAIGDLVSESIYNDTPIAAGGRLGATGRMVGGSGQNPLNKIKSLVDTGTARLTKVRSMPVISADDAEYEEALFAGEQSRVLRRKMGDGDMETVSPELIRDFIIRGTAWGKVCRYDGDTEFQRTPAYEILYDQREALHAKRWEDLSTLVHVRPENRDRLIAMYPEQAQLIADAPPFNRLDPWMAYTYVGPNTADMVEVAEAWRLPNGDKPGQTIMCLRNGTFCRRPRRARHFPLVPFYWTKPTRGVGRGVGLVYEQSAAQQWINEILADAREGIREGSQLKIFQPKAGGANKHHLRAKHPAVIEVDGNPNDVKFVAPNPVSQQAWGIAFQMAEQMEVTSGIPQWLSGGKSPLGADASGKAIDTMDDLQSDRFAHVESGYQQGRVGIGLRHVEEAREMHDEANGEVERVYDEQPALLTKDDLAAWIRDNSWPDVDIDGGDYHLALEPENFITGQRGGKLAEINEAAKAGLIPDPSLTAALFTEPDMVRANRGIIGPVRRIEQCLSDLSKLSVSYDDCAPDPEMNRSLAKLMATGELENAKAKKANPKIVQRFRDFIADLKRLDDIAAQTTQAPSLQGAQSNTTVAQANAEDLMGAGGAPPGAGAPPMPAGAPPMMPPGVS